MKTRKETRTRWVPHTVDGVTREVREDYEVEVPKLMRDTTAIGERVLLATAVAVTVASLAVSTHAIYQVIGNGWALAIGGAAVFDVAWGAALLAEWCYRFDPYLRRWASWFGWGVLVIAMGLIAADGVQQRDWLLAVGAPLVSAVAKGIWLLVLLPYMRPVSSPASQFMAAEVEESHTVRMVSGMRQISARLRSIAAAQQLSTEMRYGAPALSGGQADNYPAVSGHVSGQPDKAPDASGQMADNPGTPQVSVSTAVRTALGQHGDNWDLVRTDVRTVCPAAADDTIRRTYRRLRGEGGYI